ncbi:unnamed protein product, partial [Medioppia subpectinata]
MNRFLNYRFIHLSAKSLQSIVLNAKHVKTRHEVLSIAANAYNTSQSSVSSDVFRTANGTKSLGDLRDKRLQQMKRNTPSGEFDVLSEAIIKSTTADQLLELISLHVNVMNNKHLSDVFESLHDIIRMSDNFHDDCLRILSSKEFSDLCNQSIRRMRFFQTADLLTTLKCMVLLGLSPNTAIVKSLLQMVRQMINEFTINEIIFLDFLLSRKLTETEESGNNSSVIDNFGNETSDDFKPTKKQIIVPLVEALKLAIPLVLQLKIESKELDFDDMDLVVKCMRTAAKHNLKDDVVNGLTAAVSHRISELTISQTFSVIASLMLVSSPNSKLNINLIDRVVNQCLD